MTSNELNLIVETINNLSTHLDNITTALSWIMVALGVMTVMKFVGK